MDGAKVLRCSIVLILISSSYVLSDTKELGEEAPALTLGADNAVMPIAPDAQKPRPGNAIVVPDNCPPEQKMVGGHCHEVVDMA